MGNIAMNSHGTRLVFCLVLLRESAEGGVDPLRFRHWGRGGGGGQRPKKRFLSEIGFKLPASFKTNSISIHIFALEKRSSVGGGSGLGGRRKATSGGNAWCFCTSTKGPVYWTRGGRGWG